MHGRFRGHGRGFGHPEKHASNSYGPPGMSWQDFRGPPPGPTYRHHAPQPPHHSSGGHGPMFRHPPHPHRYQAPRFDNNMQTMPFYPQQGNFGQRPKAFQTMQNEKHMNDSSEVYSNYQHQPNTGKFMRGGNQWQGKKRPNEADHQMKKKKKMKEKPAANTCPFFCETCDRGYQMEDKYNEHISTHIKCDLDGCRYVAAAKLVQIHRDQQHRTGLAKKIWQMDSEEDLKMWIEERKKKFPTKENIEAKNKLHTDKVQRGEVLETKQFGRFKRGRGRYRGQHRNEDQRRADRPGVTESSSVTEHKTEVMKDNSKSPDKDPLAFCVDETLPDSDIEEDTTSMSLADIVSDASKMSVGGALGSLMSSYCASDNEDTHTTADKDASQLNPSNAKEESFKPKRKKNNKKKAENVHNTRHRSQSLLEKLLAREIRHERNVLLQCVRYIIQHDYFTPRPSEHILQSKLTSQINSGPSVEVDSSQKYNCSDSNTSTMENTKSKNVTIIV